MAGVKTVSPATHRRALATLALLAGLGAGVCAATEQQMSEAQFRREMGLSANQQVIYRAADGAGLSYSEFGNRVQAGSTFEVEPAAAGPVVLRLKGPATPAATPSPPASLPAFEFTTLDGQRLRAADLADRPLLLSFFFAQCVPCIQEVAILNAFATKHPEYHYLALTFDPPEEAERFVRRYHLRWPVVTGARDFISAAGVDSYPAYLLVAPQGKVLARGSGLDTRAAADPALGLALFEQWVASAR